VTDAPDEEPTSRRRLLALFGAGLLALAGAGTGITNVLTADDEETGLDLSVDYTVTSDPSAAPTPTPTPTPGDAGPPTDDGPSTDAGPATASRSPSPDATPTPSDSPRFDDGGDGSLGGGGPSTPSAVSQSADLVTATVPPVSVADLAPGDDGAVDLSLGLSGSAARFWVRVDAANFTEGTVTETERAAGDDGPPGELQDHVQVRLWLDADGDGTAAGERVAFAGSLDDLASLPDWVALTDACVPPGRHRVRFEWSVPVDAPNTVQTDGVDFSLGVAAETSDCP
jgi:hypothetical protein